MTASIKKLSLDEFLDLYRQRTVFASTTDKETQAHIAWMDEDDSMFTHPSCDEVPIEEYMEFMVKLRNLRFAENEADRRTLHNEPSVGTDTSRKRRAIREDTDHREES